MPIEVVDSAADGAAAAEAKAKAEQEALPKMIVYWDVNKLGVSVHWNLEEIPPWFAPYIMQAGVDCVKEMVANMKAQAAMQAMQQQAANEALARNLQGRNLRGR